MRTTTRLAATLAAGSLVAAGALAGLAPSPAAADPTPHGTSAASWLRGQLASGLLESFGFPDYGLSIDAARSFAAVGDQAGVAAVNTAISAHLTDYSDYSYTDMGHNYDGRASGAVAKELVLAQLVGGDPRSYGTPATDLVARLEAMVGGTGRLADVANKDGSPDPTGNFANSIGQSFAAQGLTAAGSAKAGIVTDFLLKQQCPAGFFRLNFDGDTPCTANTDPDTDVTALVVVNLQSQRTTPAVSAALAKAVTWLVTTQAADGSFNGGALTDTPNSNSTGLAAWALGASCEVKAATRAAAYVRALQVPASQTGPLSTDVGAIAYDPAAFQSGVAGGIGAARDQWRRATAQATAGLIWDPAATPTVQVSAPAGFTKGGETTTVSVTGVAAGERVCVSDPSGTRALTGTGGPLSVQVEAPRKDQEVVVSATTGPGSGSATISVLGRERLKPRLDKTLVQGDRAVVRVKSLGAKEKVKVLVDGKVVAKGKANKKGVYVGRFAARFALGTHKLKVVGQFKFRVGTTTFRVVR